MTYILSTWDPEPEKCITPGIDGITTHKLPGLDLILTNFSVVDLPYEINIIIFTMPWCRPAIDRRDRKQHPLGMNTS
jgi:hypothetical protein